MFAKNDFMDSSFFAVHNTCNSLYGQNIPHTVHAL